MATDQALDFDLDGVTIDTEETSPVVRTLEVTVDAARVDRAFARVYDELKKTARIKGFRPGKVPRPVLERMYGATVPDEIERVLVSETLAGAIQQADVAPLSEPSVDAGTPEPGTVFSYKARVEVKPEVELPDLTAITAERPIVSVGDDEIQAEIERIRDQLAPLVEAEEGTALEDGHTAVIDFVGRVDGEAFEGGTGDGVELEIGSGRFIPGFEEQLVGHASGDDVEVNVTFPEDYGHDELAGKDAVFSTTIQAVKHKQPAELDDEFAKDVGEFDTLAELEQRIRDDLTKQREEASTEALNRSLMDAILDQVDFEVPPGVVERQLRNHMEQTHRQFQGRVPDEVLRDQLMRLQEDGRPQAERRVREAFVLEAVARENDVEVEDAALDERLGELAEAQGVTVDKFKQTAEEQGWIQAIREQLLDQAVFGYLAGQATVNDVQPTPETSGVADDGSEA